MEKSSVGRAVLDGVIILLGSVVFAVGFDVFLRPADLNGGGLSGLGLILTEVTPMRTIGLFVAVCNLPLFAIGWRTLGRRFFLGSLWGMASSSALLDLFVLLPAAEVEPMVAALYGGALSGLGIGIIFLRGASTGGTGLAARLLRQRFRRFPIGQLMLAIDCAIAVLNGIVFRDMNCTLYSAVALAVSSVVTDAVIYGRSDSSVAMIVSARWREMADAIAQKLDRGATLLSAEGAHTGEPRMVVMCAVSAAQVSRLKALAAEVDPDAFVILQKARQVLGKGFGRYDHNEL